MASYADAISGIESGGNYGLLGPRTKGDRAYGKYQVMGRNIPEWTKDALGKSLTPDEFLADPQAQDAVFQHRFGQYVDKYGPEGAAKAWFAGEGGMNNPNAKDTLGTSVASYAKQFNANLGIPDVPAGKDVAPAPQVAAPQSAPLDLMSFLKPQAPQGSPSMPAYNWSPQQQPQQQAMAQPYQAPQMPQLPQPPSQLLQQLTGRPQINPQYIQSLVSKNPAIASAFRFSGLLG